MSLAFEPILQLCAPEGLWLRRNQMTFMVMRCRTRRNSAAFLGLPAALDMDFSAAAVNRPPAGGTRGCGQP